MDNEKFDKEIDKTRKTIRIIQSFGWFFVIMGFVFLVVGLYYWFLKRDDFNEVGDFIGGVSGSLWALAGLFFIYIAFLGQKIEIKYQQKELALNRKELELNRQELEESRKVFKAQAEIMLDQKLDTTFFNLLDNHRKVVNSFKDKERHYRDNVTGYDFIENTYSDLSWYLITYSSFLKSKNIYDQRITNSNPIESIEEKQYIKILYNEVLGIVEFILKKIRDENKEFYLNILYNNLSHAEKFLLSTYNINVAVNRIRELDLENYLEYDIVDFSKQSNFIMNKSLFIKEISIGLENDFIVKFDDILNYDQLDLYLIDRDNEKIELINTFTQLKGDISLLNDFKGILKNKFPNYKQIVNTEGRSVMFMILIKATSAEPNYKIFAYLNVKVDQVFGLSDSVRLISYDLASIKIYEWIRNQFNNKEN